MKLHYLAPIAALALLPVAATAQTTTETKTSTDTGMKDGVATKKTKVVHIRKHKTHRPKKILGVKVGTKTITHKTVKETTTGPDGTSTSTTVKKN